MRIDRPTGNESHLTGSFSGSFYGDFTGEVTGLSGSIEEIYEKIDEVSSSISGTLGNVSHSISGTIAGDVLDLNNRITQESSSISGTISTEVTNLYEHITGVSQSISGTISTEVTDLYSHISETSQSISGTISTEVTDLYEHITDVSQSISGTIVREVQDLNDRITRESASISHSLGTISASINDTILRESESFASTIDYKEQNLQSQINTISGTYTTTESFNQYQQLVDDTYYKSGSNVDLNQATVQELMVDKDAAVKGNMTILGNLTVEGSSSVIHTEEVTITDHFIEIASGTVDPSEANGAGFGIAGANVTMSYVDTLQGGYMQLNKPFVAPSFTGSLQGDVHGDLTGSVAGTASYASEIGDDGTIARAIIDLKNRGTLKMNPESTWTNPVLQLPCGAHKSYLKYEIAGPALTLVAISAIPGVEHYVLLTNTGDQDCIVTGSSSVMVPPSVISKYQWDYHYEYMYKDYTVPDVNIVATQAIPSSLLTVFNGKLDGGDSTDNISVRQVTLPAINVSASATVPTPLTGSIVTGSGGESHTGSYEDQFMIPKGQSLCLSYFAVEPELVLVTSAQRLEI